MPSKRKPKQKPPSQRVEHQREPCAEAKLFKAAMEANDDRCTCHTCTMVEARGADPCFLCEAKPFAIMASALSEEARAFVKRVFGEEWNAAIFTVCASCLHRLLTDGGATSKAIDVLIEPRVKSGWNPNRKRE